MFPTGLSVGRAYWSGGTARIGTTVGTAGQVVGEEMLVTGILDLVARSIPLGISGVASIFIWPSTSAKHNGHARH